MTQQHTPEKRCVHGGIQPCRQCEANARWNAAALGLKTSNTPCPQCGTKPTAYDEHPGALECLACSHHFCA
jgi:hypothetical protein